MIFAPANSCMMIEPVTMGPMPRCIREPCWPARIARREEKKSTTVDRSSPYSQTFVSAKYRRRMRTTHMIFVRKCTWPSGRRTAGMRSVIGFNLYSRLCFSSAISLVRLRRRHRSAGRLDLRLRGLRRIGHRDPQGARRPPASEQLPEPRLPEVDLERLPGLGGEALLHERVEAPLHVLDVDRVRAPLPVVMADEPVPPEVVRIVDEHPLELVLVEAGVPRPPAVPVPAPVLLPAPVRPAPAELLRPADHQVPPGPSIRWRGALLSFPRYPRAPPTLYASFGPRREINAL